MVFNERGMALINVVLLLSVLLAMAHLLADGAHRRVGSLWTLGTVVRVIDLINEEELVLGT